MFSASTIGMILAFSMVILIGFGLGVFILLNPKRTASDRLDDMMGKPGEEQSEAVREAIAARLGQLAQSQDEEERNLLKIKLLQAGYRDPRSTDVYNAARVALLMILPLLVSPILAFQSTAVLLLGVVIGAIVGYMLPHFVVNGRIASRQRAYSNPFLMHSTYSSPPSRLA